MKFNNQFYVLKLGYFIFFLCEQRQLYTLCIYLRFISKQFKNSFFFLPFSLKLKTELIACKTFLNITKQKLCMWPIVTGVFVQIQPKCSFMKSFLSIKIECIKKENEISKSISFLMINESSLSLMKHHLFSQAHLQITLIKTGGDYGEAKRNNNTSSLMKFYDKLERKNTSSFKIISLSFQQAKPIFAEKYLYILNRKQSQSC